MIRIYTRGGDQGMTSVIGSRVPKDSTRVEAYGTVDEVNSFVGLAVAHLEEERFTDLKQDLLRIQHELFDAGSDLAVVVKEVKVKGAQTKDIDGENGEHAEEYGPSTNQKRAYKVNAEMVKHLEELIDKYHSEAPEIRKFVLPGGSKVSAYLHVCRVLTRRAERRVVTLAKEEPHLNLEVRRYLNRLSDFFFAAARCANTRAGVTDVEYERGGDVFR